VQFDNIACRDGQVQGLENRELWRPLRVRKSAAVHLQGLEEGEVEEGPRETWLGHRIEQVDVEFPDATEHEGAEPAINDGQVAGEGLPVLTK
jgi:hypothetical protein